MTIKSNNPMIDSCKTLTFILSLMMYIFKSLKIIIRSIGFLNMNPPSAKPCLRSCQLWHCIYNLYSWQTKHLFKLYIIFIWMYCANKNEMKTNVNGGLVFVLTYNSSSLRWFFENYQRISDVFCTYETSPGFERIRRDKQLLNEFLLLP